MGPVVEKIELMGPTGGKIWTLNLPKKELDHKTMVPCHGISMFNGLCNENIN